MKKPLVMVAMIMTCLYGQGVGQAGQVENEVEVQEAVIGDDTTEAQESAQQDVIRQVERPQTLNSDASEAEFINYPIVDNFEESGLWQGEMPRDHGIVRVMRRDGNPSSLEGSDDNRFVLGAKVSFFKTGAAWFALTPPREVFIEGKSEKLEVWVVGRGFRHSLKAGVRDVLGTVHLLNFGELRHTGWEKLEVQIPENVKQEHKRSPQSGIYFQSLVIDCNMFETFGNYYVYFDNLTAKVDRSAVDLEEDNIEDDW